MKIYYSKCVSCGYYEEAFSLTEAQKLTEKHEEEKHKNKITGSYGYKVKEVNNVNFDNAQR